MGTLYSSDSKPTGEQEMASRGFNLNIQQSETVATNKATSSGSIVDSIVQQAAKSTEQEKKVLDELKQFDQKLDIDLPIGPMVEQNTKLARTIFIATVIISLLIVGFFAFKNSNQFFAALGLAEPNHDTLEKQSALNLRSQKITNDLLIAALKAETLAISTSKYAAIVNSDMAMISISKKQQFRKEIEANLATIKQSITKVKSEYAADPEAEATTILYISEQISKLKTDSAVAQAEQKRRISLLENAAKLVKVGALLDPITPEVLSNYSDAELVSFLRKFFLELNNNYLDKVAFVQLKRVSWTDVFNELETVIKKLDPTFDVFKPAENGKIVLSSYSFIAESDTISLGGQITTPTDDTFSVIANTIDALETSPKFQDIAYRSYSKSFQEGSGYKSSVNFTIKLENE